MSENQEPQKQQSLTSGDKNRVFKGLTMIVCGFLVLAGILSYFFYLQLNKSNRESTLAIAKLQQQLQFDKFVQSGLLTSDTPTAIKDNDQIPTLGDKNAPITIDEFADFQCPFCHEFFSNVLPQLKSAYIDTGKVKFTYHVYAFLGDESIRAAQAAKCAADQGKFWQYHDSLYDNQKTENSGGFSDANLKSLAQKIGADQNQFNQCLATNKYADAVNSDTQLGSSYGVSATPTIFFNGYKTEGVQSYAQYSALIDYLLISNKTK